MDSKIIWLLVVLLICTRNNSWIYGSLSVSKEEDLELERQLKILNKSPVKTIQTDEGDTIDCIDIYKQPAFDHPRLKNHKVQLKPSSFPAGLSKTSSTMKSTKIRFMKEACPTGTVPIKRTLKEDLVRTKSLFEQPSPINFGKDVTFPGTHIVSVMATASGTPYFGGTCEVAAYNLSIAPDQSSSTNMWIESGSPEDVSLIATGWMVSQRLNGDGLTRVFTYWTGNGYKSGCYNTLCPGFVVTNKEAGLNLILAPSSIRGGPIYTQKLLIYQDTQTRNWWLSVSESDIVIGYWPIEIFNHLRNGAKRVAWGAETYAGQNGISPPMGNGYKPNNHYRDTCFFGKVSYLNDQREPVTLSKEHQVTQHVDKSGCYGLDFGGNWPNIQIGVPGMGFSFMFGGPGGNCSL